MTSPSMTSAAAEVEGLPYTGENLSFPTDASAPPRNTPHGLVDTQGCDGRLGTGAVEDWDVTMPDMRRQDAALGAATTVWSLEFEPMVLPLTFANPSIHSARLCAEMSRHPFRTWADEARA